MKISILPPILVIIVLLSTIAFAVSYSLLTMQSENSMQSAVKGIPNKSQNIVDIESSQSFSGAIGSTIEYNIYIENKGKDITSYTLTALSNQGYSVQVWMDTDQIGSGDTQLIPPPGTTIIMSADEVATIIVKVVIPPDATEGTLDNTVIKAVCLNAESSDYVTISTTVDSGLPYPSNWIQLGSDNEFPTPPPEQVDVKATYYSNNGTCVFFRIAEARQPDTTAFVYDVYLDLQEGGQQVDIYTYDYLLSSDGILYEWNDNGWVDSGYPTYWRVDGTAIVLWTDLDNMIIDAQNINMLFCTTTKSKIFKDSIGPYTILRNNISEMPLILMPFATLAISFFIFKKSLNATRTKRVEIGAKRNWSLSNLKPKCFMAIVPKKLKAKQKEGRFKQSNNKYLVRIEQYQTLLEQYFRSRLS